MISSEPSEDSLLDTGDVGNAEGGGFSTSVSLRDTASYRLTGADTQIPIHRSKREQRKHRRVGDLQSRVVVLATRHAPHFFSTKKMEIKKFQTRVATKTNWLHFWLQLHFCFKKKKRLWWWLCDVCDVTPSDGGMTNVCKSQLRRSCVALFALLHMA